MQTIAEPITSTLPSIYQEAKEQSLHHTWQKLLIKNWIWNSNHKHLNLWETDLKIMIIIMSEQLWVRMTAFTSPLFNQVGQTEGDIAFNIQSCNKTNTMTCFHYMATYCIHYNNYKTTNYTKHFMHHKSDKNNLHPLHSLTKHKYRDKRNKLHSTSNTSHIKTQKNITLAHIK